jgi:hypothetical protein
MIEDDLVRASIRKHYHVPSLASLLFLLSLLGVVDFAEVNRSWKFTDYEDRVKVRIRKCV